jgi:hypothetical protein
MTTDAVGDRLRAAATQALANQAAVEVRKLRDEAARQWAIMKTVQRNEAGQITGVLERPVTISYEQIAVAPVDVTNVTTFVPGKPTDIPPATRPKRPNTRRTKSIRAPGR